MEVLGPAFHVTIEDILKLTEFNEDICYNISEIEMFQPLASLDTWGLEIKTAEKLTEKDMIKDLTNDGRSRQLSILLYESIPFALYQYIGKGNVNNEVIFNKDVYLKFLKDYMNEYIEKKSDIKVVDLNSEYKAENYDFGVFIIEDKCITSICKTDLATYKK